MARSETQAGFTLIEVLIVLVILGLAIGLVAARGPARSPALEAHAAAGQVARALRLARSEALLRNAEVAFTLDAARHGFRVGDGAWRQLPPTVALQMHAADGAADPARGQIVFAPDGGATGGRVRIATRGKSVLVAVDWLSGRVSIADAAP